MALATGSTADLRALASADCRGCSNFTDSVEQVIGAGGSFQGGTWTLVSTHKEKLNATNAEFTAAVEIAKGVTISEAGAAPVKYKATKHLMSFDLVLGSEGWQFSVVAFIS